MESEREKNFNWQKDFDENILDYEKRNRTYEQIDKEFNLISSLLKINIASKKVYQE